MITMINRIRTKLLGVFMQYRYLNLKIENHVAYCTMNNPPKQTMVATEVRELLSLIEELEADENVRVLVLTGADENIFITHYEVGELSDMSHKRQSVEKPATEKKKKLYPFNRLCFNLENTRLVTIAAVNGDASGGGWEVALSCDFRLSKKGNHLMGLPETEVGIIPGAGGTQRMARLLGVAKALDLILHGTKFTSVEAYSLGLIHRIYEAARFNEEVKIFAEGLAGRSPVALREAKMAIRLGIQAQNMEEALLIEQSGFDITMKSEDAAGAMKAWLKGEKYEWKGR